jgi:hypothetical protein
MAMATSSSRTSTPDKSTIKVFTDAVKNGDVHTMTRLHDAHASSPGKPWHEKNWSYKLCGRAAEHGQLRALQWLHNKQFYWDASTTINAAEHGHLGILEWARKRNCPWNKWVCVYAAKHGHLHILQWAIQHGCPWDKSYILASNISDEVRHWVLHQPACAPYLLEDDNASIFCDDMASISDTAMCNMTAGREGIFAEALQFAIENRITWDERTCTLAAQAGLLHVLQWARAHGCPWNKATILSTHHLTPEVRAWVQAQPE